MSMLEVKNIKKAFNGNVVVDDVSFTLEKGKILGLLGKNGSGKSTIIKMINDLLTIDSGSILNSYENIMSHNKNVLVVCQDSNLSSQLKKKFNENNINYSIILYGMDAVDRIKSGKKYDYIEFGMAVLETLTLEWHLKDNILGSKNSISPISK